MSTTPPSNHEAPGSPQGEGASDVQARAGRERRITVIPNDERRRLFDRRRKPLPVPTERRQRDRRDVGTAAGFTGVPFARSAELDLDEFFDDGHQILDEVLANSARHITIAYTPVRPSGSIAHGVSVGRTQSPAVDASVPDDGLADAEFADGPAPSPTADAPTASSPAPTRATTKDTTAVLAHRNDLMPRGRVAPHPVTLLGNRAPAAGQTSVVPDPRRFIDFYSRKIGWVYEIDSPKWGFYSGWRPTLEWTKKAGKRMMNLIDSWGEPDDTDEFV